MPAFGGDPLARKISRIGKRVDSLDRRLKATALLAIGKDVDVERLTGSGQVGGPANTASAKVNCLPGYEAIGGGASFNDPRNGDTLIFSRPDVGGQGWEAFARRPEGVTSGTLTVYVICLDQR